MTSASRRRRGGRNGNTLGRTDPTVLRTVPAVPAECDCPACTGADVDPEQMLGELLDGLATLAECEDALDAEMAGAALMAMVTAAGDDLVPAFIQGFIRQVEARPDKGGLALMLAVGSVASGVQEEVAQAASEAAGRLVAAGTPEPRWAGELAGPVQVGDCLRLSDDQETTSVLAASFRRAGHGHAFLVIVDEQDCGACADIVFLAEDHLPAVLDGLRADGRADGLEITTRTLDPAEFRWYVEEALSARAVHDEEDAVDPADAMFGEDDDETSDGDEEEGEGPPYPVLEFLVRGRLAALPAARRPTGARENPHASGNAATLLDDFTAIARLAAGAGGGPRGGFGAAGFGRPAPAKLPAKRKKSNGPAPIYQVKVGLRDAKPPIWRRLLVPADVSLARLHDMIQVAFGWHGGHLHVFETPYGDFGYPDRELGHRAEAPVTLEQVAPQVKDKIRYLYDFGDSWSHDIVVEQVLDRDPATVYPRCTGGRRAAPPDDCGGIWGYEALLEILADPRHPEHQERLEWLGLDDPEQLDPAAFDLDEMNRALSKLS